MSPVGGLITAEAVDAGQTSGRDNSGPGRQADMRIVVWAANEASLPGRGENESSISGVSDWLSNHPTASQFPLTADGDLPGMSFAVGDCPLRHSARAYCMTIGLPTKTRTWWLGQLGWGQPS
jgi:hypothetical protein